MSTYFHLSFSDATELLRQFQYSCVLDLGHLLSVDEIGEGFQNSAFRLATTTGPFVLKVMEPPIDSLAVTSAEQQHVIHLACHAMGMRVPQPLGRIVEVKGRPAQLMRLVDGFNPSKVGPDQARTLGRRAAEFQLGLQGVAGVCPRRRARPARLLIQEAISAARRGRSRPHAGEFAYMAASFDLAMGFFRTRRYLEQRWVPRGMTHADMNRGNILLTPDGNDVAAFLDFDSVSTGFLLRDLVKLIYEFSLIPDEYNRFCIDRDITLSLIEGYSTVRPLLRAELESIEAVLDVTSRWQTASHRKLRLVGRHSEDAAAIEGKAQLIGKSRHVITQWLREARML